MKDLSIKKLYYSISEVSKITELEQYVLRYWENEFDELKPSKNRAGNRIYTNKDIQLILFVKKLLRDEKYTIDGAKQILKTYKPTETEDVVSFDNLNLKTSEVIPGTKDNKKINDVELNNKLNNLYRLLKSIYNKL